jgi:hypothetical protein
MRLLSDSSVTRTTNVIDHFRLTASCCSCCFEQAVHGPCVGDAVIVRLASWSSGHIHMLTVQSARTQNN